MWYVIQVMAGHEEQMAERCRKGMRRDGSGGSPLRECFVPYTEQLKRYLGEWHMEQKVLFPGYVFLVSDNPEGLGGWLERIEGFTKLLAMEHTPLPLAEEEVALMERLGGARHVVEHSVGIIVDGQIIVRKGPLKGLEGCVRKIDRHKRKAWIEVKMMDRMMPTQVGLEITEKRATKKCLAPQAVPS